MKLEELVSPMREVTLHTGADVHTQKPVFKTVLVELDPYEVRVRQVRKLKLALAQAPDKATRRRLEREIARQEVLTRDGGTVPVRDYLEGVPF